MEKQFILPKLKKNRLYVGIYHAVTMFFVILGWVLFRAESIGSAWAYITSMFGDGNGFTDAVFAYNVKNGWTVLLVGIFLALPIIKSVWSRITNGKAENELRPALVATKDITVSLATVIIFVIAVAVSVKSTYNPFIYFNF